MVRERGDRGRAGINIKKGAVGILGRIFFSFPAFNYTLHITKTTVKETLKYSGSHERFTKYETWISFRSINSKKFQEKKGPESRRR